MLIIEKEYTIETPCSLNFSYVNSAFNLAKLKQNGKQQDFIWLHYGHDEACEAL